MDVAPGVVVVDAPVIHRHRGDAEADQAAQDGLPLRFGRGRVRLLGGLLRRRAEMELGPAEDERALIAAGEQARHMDPAVDGGDVEQGGAVDAIRHERGEMEAGDGIAPAPQAQAQVLDAPLDLAGMPQLGIDHRDQRIGEREAEQDQRQQRRHREPDRGAVAAPEVGTESRCQPALEANRACAHGQPRARGRERIHGRLLEAG